MLYARPHPKGATASGDSVGPPTDFQLFQDKLWAVLLARANGTLTLASAPDGSGAQTFAVEEGVNTLQLPLVPGGSMRGTLVRAGETVIDLKAEGFTFNANPSTYNYNVFTAHATSD